MQGCVFRSPLHLTHHFERSRQAGFDLHMPFAVIFVHLFCMRRFPSYDGTQLAYHSRHLAVHGCIEKVTGCMQLTRGRPSIKHVAMSEEHQRSTARFRGAILFLAKAGHAPVHSEASSSSIKEEQISESTSDLYLPLSLAVFSLFRLSVHGFSAVCNYCKHHRIAAPLEIELYITV